MSRTTLWRLLKDQGYQSWKPVKVQFLSDEDHENRVNCCQHILQKYENSRRSDNLFFSDECAFYAEGKNALQVCMWSKGNPHFYEQISHHPPMVMTWAAMSAKHLIGPFFIEGSVTTDSYIQMLKTQLIPALNAKGLLYVAHFQQDGAPAHTAIKTRNFLNQHFPDRWIGKYGPVAWPARSPDLSSCDNALWGMLKPKIVKAKVKSKEELKDVIRQAFGQFPQTVLPSINKRTFHRLHLCIEKGGFQVDPFDP
jgi:hypothetical protein